MKKKILLIFFLFMAILIPCSQLKREKEEIVLECEVVKYVKKD